MDEHKHKAAIAHNFSLAFEQMCSIVAIGQIKGADEVLKELLLQCLVIFPGEEFCNEEQFSNVLDVLFGLRIPDHEIRYALDRLLSERTVIKNIDDRLFIPPDIKEELQKNISESLSLEEKVRDGWKEEIAKNYPDISFDQAWKALRYYLAKTFQRHGMQTVALLDPLLEIPPEYTISLSELINESVKEFPTSLHLSLKNTVSGFLATIGNYPYRSIYIAQLADGAFNYFSLTVETDIAEQFRRNLNPLKLFLDTNFLFGILDLDVGPQVAVSIELINAIQKYKFPFELIYHKETEKELLTSIENKEGILGSQNWSRNISRAATTSRFLSGVESKYHQRYAETGIDVKSFFKPYKHSDILLAQKNIKLFTPETDRVREKSELINEYSEYIKVKYKEKTYALIDHDMTVLDIVRSLRSNSKSTLEAGTLLITCDYMLYKFDWETSKPKGILPCTILPNLFWQILRPFVPSDVDFSRSFAETFAIPEFRTIGSGASQACSKMLSILAGYKGFPEDTAVKMLSNDLLIDHLRRVENDQEFQEYIESAIVAENAELAEEKASLSDHLEQERIEKLEAKEQLDQISKQREEERSKAEQAQRKYEQIHEEDKEQIEKISEEVERERQLREKAEKQVTEFENKTKTIYKAILTIAISVFLIVIFELITYLLPWGWLVNHKNSYGLQASIDAILVLGISGLFIQKWRKLCWIVAGLPILLGILQLLGGPIK